MEIIPSLIPALLLVLPFLVTYLALRVILFGPLVTYLEERDAVSGTAHAEAEAFVTATSDKLSELEKRLTVARRDIGELRKAARTTASQEEAKMLAEARAQGEARVAEASARIGQEKHVAATTLRGTAKILSAEIATQVLGRSARSGEA